MSIVAGATMIWLTKFDGDEVVGAVELETIPGQPGKRGFDAYLKAYDAGILIRVTGDIIAMSPPLIISEAQIDELVGKLAEVLKAVE